MIRTCKHHTILAILLGGLLCTATALATPPSSHPDFLWKISLGQKVLFIAGMPGLLQAQDYPLPAAFENVFALCGELVTEGDGPAADQKVIAHLIHKLGMQPNGTKLSGELSGNGRHRLQRVAEKLSLPIGALDQFKPWLAALIIDQRQLKQHGIDPAQNMLFHFYDEAKAGGMRVVSLESGEQQIRYFAALTQPLQIQWLNMAEAGVRNWDAQYSKIINAWRGGNSEATARLLNQEFKGKSALRQALVTARNQRWSKQLERISNNQQKPVFVVVGSGHLVGPNNLLDLLQKDGYSITQL